MSLTPCAGLAAVPASTGSTARVLSVASVASAISAIPAIALPDLRRLALPAIFAWYGLLMGSWAGRLTAVKQGLQLTHSQLAMVLLCVGLGAVLSPPLSSRLLARFGSLGTLRCAGLTLTLVLMVAAAAPSLPTLMLAVLALGITASTFDVAMNGLAARHEALLSTPMMSRLHACACAGGLAGVTLGSGMAALQVTPLQQFSLLALPLAGLLYRCLHGLNCMACSMAMTEDDDKPDTSSAADAGGADDAADGKAASSAGAALQLPRGRLAMLGLLGLLGAIAEGSISSWSGLFMKEQFGASDAMAPLSLSAFSMMMLISRCWGDPLKAKHGARALVCTGSATAACGLGLAVFAPGAVIALAGFALAGLGLALVFPFVYSAAGKESKAALAAVATMGYAGSLAGPPLMGAIAEGLGLQAAIASIALLVAAMAVVASRARLLH
jgi:MFS family permease